MKVDRVDIIISIAMIINWIYSYMIYLDPKYGTLNAVMWNLVFGLGLVWMYYEHRKLIS